MQQQSKEEKSKQPAEEQAEEPAAEAEAAAATPATPATPAVNQNGPLPAEVTHTNGATEITDWRNEYPYEEPAPPAHDNMMRSGSDRKSIFSIGLAMVVISAVVV